MLYHPFTSKPSNPHSSQYITYTHNTIESRKKWKQQEIKYGPRPTIQDANPYENKEDEFIAEDKQTNKTLDDKLQDVNADYDSLDELEREIMGDDDDKELARIQAKRKDQLKTQWKKKQEEMAQV